MIEKKVIETDRVSDSLLANLGSRDVALWIQSLPEGESTDTLVAFLGLPWRLVFSEVYDAPLIKALEDRSSFSDPMTRKRGFVQVIDSDPSRIELPQRCLPIYLLNGRQAGPSSFDFENRLRRLTMLETLRRSGTREVLIVSGNQNPVPPDLKELWASGFRSYLTFISDDANASGTLESELQQLQGVAAVNLVRLSARRAVEEILARYADVYPEHRVVIRVRDRRGTFHRIDVTEADEPERPILERYSLAQERDLTPLLPEELSEADFVGFFRNPGDSWRPYAAGLPWVRDSQTRRNLSALLRKLDDHGPDENCVAYISAESGAGGSTLARMLAWECAREGYPVLLAKALPFVPDALPIANFLNRVHGAVEDQILHSTDSGAIVEGSQVPEREHHAVGGRYEAPWVIVFDSLHWQYRDSELVRFRNELQKSGRPACILVVTGTVLGLSFYNSSVFRKIAELNHALDLNEARQLGRHLNQYLRVYNKQRQEWQWDQFYQGHTVRYLEGISAFWVTLSFWIQGQYDLSESIQEWMYRTFKERVADRVLQDAILEIAALSSERLPLPEPLLPASTGKWPVSVLLEDNRPDLSALGLLRISADGERHWALVHDILGRFLINALFYDFPMREQLGFAEARDAEHLRFLLLRKISQKPALGERAHRSVGEDFATSIFKVDPDHGRGGFASLWREVLDALDKMPRSLVDTSRVFRHHTAVSRRRIAKLDETYYGVKGEDRIALLNEAIEDINYALNFVDYAPGGESNLNLFNSLANAYLDLVELEEGLGASRERIIELRKLANEATSKAYAESPTNSFVIETYVKNLLESARDSSDKAVEYCIEALGILFSELASDEAKHRKSQLGSLADQALAILFKQKAATTTDAAPASAIDVLLKAWQTLAAGSENWAGIIFTEVPEENRKRALDVLGHAVGRGNMQVLRLSFDLTSITYPYAFKKQLELVEQLQGLDYRMTPQLRLEYAILLFQAGRAVEGDRAFRSLRQLWRDSEHFVEVPNRLRWLRAADGKALQTVQAITGSDYGSRAMARVQEFGNALVPFRAEEHGFRDLRPGLRFACHVSFGHNGPFLRPVTAHPTNIN